jgi:hypothetical protein
MEVDRWWVRDILLFFISGKRKMRLEVLEAVTEAMAK